MMNKIRRITRDTHSMVTVFLLISLYLMMRNLYSCPQNDRLPDRVEFQSIKDYPETEPPVKSPKRLEKQKKARETFERNKQSSKHRHGQYIQSNGNISESDLMSVVPAKVNLVRYRRLLLAKLTELKKNGVEKSQVATEPCLWDRPGGPCVDNKCKNPLPDPLSDENLSSVLKPVYRMRHDALEKVTALFGSIPRGSRVTFLTASSSNHFLEAQAMLKNLHTVVFPKLSNYTFYFYDIGLKEKERQQLKNFCKCHVVKYPLDLLPKRFGFLRGFTWKPIIINAHLSTTDYVVWADSSVRFRTSNLEPMFNDARSRGLVFGSVFKFNEAEHTSKAMFDYYGNTACQFSQYEQGEAGFQVIYNEPFMREFFMKVWTGCALDPQCMCSEYDVRQFSCNQKIRKNSKCHRTDQSAHTLILVKLFREKISSFYIRKGKYHILRRHETLNYFEYLETKSKRLN